MATSFVRINGIDPVNSNLAILVERVDGLTPIVPVRVEQERGLTFQEPQTRRITVSMIVNSTTTTGAMQGKIEQIAELCGAFGSTQKEVAFEYSSATTMSPLTPAWTTIYLCVCESFDVEYYDPVAISMHARVRITFRITGQQDYNGRTTRSDTLTASAIGYKHLYFNDSSFYQSSTPLIMRLSPAGSLNPAVYNLAAENDFYLAHTASSAGNIGIVDGRFGLPAISITANSTYLRYPIPLALPIYGVDTVTAVIRFKRNYAMSHATAKYLLDEGSQFRISIDATTQTIRLTGTGTAVTVSGASVSDSLWNTIVATVSGTSASLHLYTSGEVTASVNDWTPFTTTNLYMYVGNSAAGTNPCQSYISEVAIYKHPLPQAGREALYQLLTPIRESRILDLSRNLTFLLDFRDGFTASANKVQGVAIQNAITSSETLLLDFERMIAKKINKTSGLFTEISNELALFSGMSPRITVGKYNKFAFTVPTAASLVVNSSYYGARYR